MAQISSFSERSFPPSRHIPASHSPHRVLPPLMGPALAQPLLQAKTWAHGDIHLCFSVRARTALGVKYFLKKSIWRQFAEPKGFGQICQSSWTMINSWKLLIISSMFLFAPFHLHLLDECTGFRQAGDALRYQKKRSWSECCLSCPVAV